MNIATAITALALTVAALSAQGREPAPLERLGRAGAPSPQGVVVNSAAARALNVALVQGRAGPALAGSRPAMAKSRMTQREVSRVMGRG